MPARITSNSSSSSGSSADDKIAGDLRRIIDIKSAPLVPVIIETRVEDYIPAHIKRYLRDVLKPSKLRILSRLTALTKRLLAITIPSYLVDALSRDEYVKRIYLDHKRGIPELFSLENTMLNIRLERLGTIRDDVRSILRAKQQMMTIFAKRRDEAAATVLSSDITPTAEVIEGLGVTQLHKANFLGQNIKLAIIDTGATPLVFNLHAQSGAKVVPIQYINATTTTVNADTNGHGTHVFTIAAGQRVEVVDRSSSRQQGGGASGVVVVGMAPLSTKIVVKALTTPMGIGSDSNVIAAISQAISQGAEVINMSLGSPASDEEEVPKEDDALVRFIEAFANTNIIFCIASGNDGSTKRISSPAIAENAIAIGAYDFKTGKVAGFSNKGEGLDFIMPGVNIFSGIQPGTLLDGIRDVQPGYAVLSGTSMATPFAAGLLAVIKQIYKAKGKDLTWVDVIKAGRERGEPWTPERGYGVLSPDLFLVEEQ
ncbi:MAG: S8 family serine peptidase [Candidatus Anstonellales archaeon]